MTIAICAIVVANLASHNDRKSGMRRGSGSQLTGAALGKPSRHRNL
jgi:hypothetical protein